MTLKSGTRGLKFFLAYPHNYGLTQNDGIWHGNTGGEKRVSTGQNVPHLKKMGPSVPNFGAYLPPDGLT